jgi:uncharacterized protein involved in type VI secretion and phage assembly
MAVLGAAMSAWAQMEAGKTAEKTGEYNAQVAAADAAAAKESAAYEEKKHRIEAQKLQARQRARYAKAGVKFEGTPLMVMEESQAEAEEEALMIRRQGEVAAQRYWSQGRIARKQGKIARRTGYLMAGATLLTGAAKDYYGHGGWSGMFGQKSGGTK